MYRVVQCGTAGHNVRSKPSMRGTPVGRLSKSSTVEAIEEVRFKKLVIFRITYRDVDSLFFFLG